MRFLQTTAFLACSVLSVAAAGNRSNSIASSPDGARLVVVNSDSDSVSVVDTTLQRTLAEITVGDNPQMVAINPAGTLAYVTNRGEDTVSIVDLASFESRCALAVADEPVGIAVASDGQVYVSSWTAGVVQVIESNQPAVVAAIETEPGPRGLALSDDGSELYVTHFSSGRLSVIHTESRSVLAVIETGLDTNLSQGVLVDEGRAYLPQTRSNAGNQALLFDTTVFPVVSIVDLQTRQHLLDRRIHLEIADRPVNLPLDVVRLENGVLYVLNAGSNDLSVIDPTTGRASAHIDVGDHPRGMVLSPDGEWLYVNNSLDGSVSVISTQSNQVAGTIAVTEIPLPRDVLNGKRLFNSSDRMALARDQWISCATCHFDGEMDGRTWFFPDGPRNTPSLLGVSDTLPIHWSGDLDELHDVEVTVRTIQAGTGLVVGPDHCDPACDQGLPNAGRSVDLDDLARFMAALNLPDNPNRDSHGRRNAVALRGKALFESDAVGCSGCHVPPRYTDRLKHDVGTGDGAGERKGPSFDVPSLRGIYKTAPYLHDGSAGTLSDVLTTRNLDDRHGKTSQLSDSQTDDLVAFLLSLSQEFTINTGLNGAWIDPTTPGQGFFLEVLPDTQRVVLAWLTFDTTQPPADPGAQVGYSGHRWLTAQGPFNGTSANLGVTLTIGGLFHDAAPVTHAPAGTIVLEFDDCTSGTIDYDLSISGVSGRMSISRLAGDSLELCESLIRQFSEPVSCDLGTEPMAVR